MNRILVIIYLLLECAMATAQTDVEFAELDLRANAEGDSLLVYVRITGPSDFSGNVTEVKYTIRYASTGITDTGIYYSGYTNFCQGGWNLILAGWQVNYYNGFAYATMNGFGAVPISTACPDQFWPAGEWQLIQRLHIINIDEDCVEFQIVNDDFTTITERETLIELMDTMIDHEVEQTPAYIGGCSTSIDPLGDAENDTESIYLWPNPATDELAISIGSCALSGPITITLTDMQGRIIRTVQSSIQHVADNFRIPIADLAPGMYLIQVENEGRAIGRRFIKQ